MTHLRHVRVAGALALALSLAAVAGLAPARAIAGEYTVTACDPQVAGGANRSWTPEISHGGMTAYPVCPAGSQAFDQGLVTRHATVAGNNFASVPAFANAAWLLRAPPGTAIVRARYEHSLCGGADFSAGLYDSANQPLHVSTKGCGTLAPSPLTLELGGLDAIKVMTICAKSTCNVGRGLQAYGTVRSMSVTLRDDAAPQVAITGGPLVDGRWHRDVSSVDVKAADNVGVTLVQSLVDGQPSREIFRPCADLTLLVRCSEWNAPVETEVLRVSDGRHQVVARAVDATGNVAISGPRSVLIDNTAPARPIAFRLQGGLGWRNTNRFDLAWTNPDLANGSPIDALLYEICPAANTSGLKTGCASGRRSATRGAVENFTLPVHGEWRARFWLEDQAGNHNPGTAEEITLAFDDDAPRLTFLDSDPEDPTRVRVSVSDPTSAPARGEIEARREGGTKWRSLDTKLDGGLLSAVLDDEALPDGLYELRARVFDLAGNERSTDEGADGRPVRVALPVRVRTRLAVGRVKRVRSRRTRNGRRVYRRTLVVRPRSRYGQTVRLSGRLTAPGANPLADRDVEVFEQLALPGAPWRPIATVRTSRTGRFVYRALRGASRTLRFRYGGTGKIRGRTSDVRLLVKAVTSLRANRRAVVNGEDVVFRGRLKGGPLPSTSKLLQLQAFSRGRWLTFATPRADSASGLWSYRYRFAATRGRVRYRFRARVPREGSYPYETGISRVTRVTVRGL